MMDKNEIKALIADSLYDKEIIDENILMKCGKSVYNGYYEGKYYAKDNKQRHYEVRSPNPYAEKGYLSYYEAHNGDIENKQLKEQNKINWSEEEERAFASFSNDFGVSVGYDIHGVRYEELDDVGDPDPGFGPFSPDDEGGFPRGADTWYEEMREEYVKGRLDDIKTIEKMFEKAPGLVTDTRLYTMDIPNPNLKEGDIFELDTYMPISFKQASQENKYNSPRDSAIDTNISRIRDGGVGTGVQGLVETDYKINYDSAPWSSDPNASYRRYGKDLPFNDAYKVMILGSNGTPILLNQGNIKGNDSYLVDNSDESFDAVKDGYWEEIASPHDAFLNKGQKMKVVKFIPEKQIAIYQTVE